MVKHNHIIPTRKHGKHGYACWFRRSTCKTKGGRIARQQSKTTEVFPRQHTTNAPLGCPGIKFRQLKACTRRIPDLISELPDDILVKILSLVPIKEAAKTSVLSKRWVHAWAYIPILNFDPGNIHDTLWVDSHTFNNVKFVTEELRYIRWVNGVVRSHKASTVDKFRLLFYLQDDRKRDIDNWIRFAMEKRVKRLELDFTGYGRELRCLYNLPTFSSLCSSLTSLQLASVNVSGEALERFISNCRGLEYISVKQSKLLVELKITGPSLNLKSLQIVDCWKIKFLEISAPSLRSFYYEGPKLNLSFRSTPKIAEVSICGFHAEHLVYDYSDFLNCASQIEVLTLDFPVDIHVMEVFPICTRLKVLNLSVPAECEEDLFHFSSLIKACPLLHKFVLQLDYLDKLRFKKKRKRKREREPCPHNHLKIVEIVGFLGGKVDAGFVKYLLDIAVSLQKIIFDTRNPPSNVDRDEKTIKKATKVANQMRVNIRRGIEVVIC